MAKGLLSKKKKKEGAKEEEEEIEQTGRVICHQMTKFKFKKQLVKYN